MASRTDQQAPCTKPLTRPRLALSIVAAGLTSLLAFHAAQYRLFDWFEAPYLYALLSRLEYDPGRPPPIVLIVKDWRFATLKGDQRALLEEAVAQGPPAPQPHQGKLTPPALPSEDEFARAALARLLTRLCDLKARPAAVVLDIEFAVGRAGGPGTDKLVRALDGASGKGVPVVLGLGPLPETAYQLRGMDLPASPSECRDPLLRLYYQGLTQSTRRGETAIRVGSVLVGRSYRRHRLQRKEAFLAVASSQVQVGDHRLPVYGLGLEAVAAARRVGLVTDASGGGRWRSVVVPSGELPEGGQPGREVRVPVGYAGDPYAVPDAECWQTVVRLSETVQGLRHPFPRHDYWEFIEGGRLSREAARSIANAIVFIGDVTGDDRFPVPLAGEMDGVELHAHVANMVKEAGAVRFVPLELQSVIWWLAGIGVCCFALTGRLKPGWKSLAAVAVPLATGLALAGQLFFVFYPIVAIHGATWSAARIDSAFLEPSGQSEGAAKPD
jgi:CHASE2 domain